MVNIIITMVIFQDALKYVVGNCANHNGKDNVFFHLLFHGEKEANRPTGAHEHQNKHLFIRARRFAYLRGMDIAKDEFPRISNIRMRYQELREDYAIT